MHNQAKNSMTRLLLSWSILAILCYKIAEPMVATLRLVSAMEQPVPQITASTGQIEVKLYAPLPYGVSWEEAAPLQKAFQKGDAFYNLVKRRYENDTLYFTLERNLNAHDAFDALSSIVNTLLSDGQGDHSSTHHTTTTAEDFMKVFPPATPPRMVAHACQWHDVYSVPIWHYALRLPICTAEVPVPPPDFA